MNLTQNDSTAHSGTFVTTRWNLILSGADSKGGDREIRAALAELCRIYWRPIFFFVAHQGYSPEDAEDLTQDFFLKILKRDWLKKADPNRGRFRSLLRKSVQNFLNDTVDRNSARKRGGDLTFISWDPWMTQAPSELVLSSEALNSWPSERLFDAGWAATVVQRAIRRLRDECERKGRLSVFEVLYPYVTAERDDMCYARVASELKVAQSAVKKLLYRVRRRYRFLLRAEVAQTVADPADVDDELRYLCGALASGSHAT